MHGQRTVKLFVLDWIPQFKNCGIRKLNIIRKKCNKTNLSYRLVVSRKHKVCENGSASAIRKRKLRYVHCCSYLTTLISTPTSVQYICQFRFHDFWFT